MVEDGESSRVSADSSSWLVGGRQRFTIELRPGETTIVSWKRLVKDAQNTSSSHLTAPNTENSLDECFQDNKSMVKPKGLLVNSDKPECINEPVLSVAQQLRKRSEAQGEKVDGHLPRKHAKLEQGRLNFAATKALLEEESSVLVQDLADTSQRDLKLHKLLNSSVRSSVKKPANIGTKSECVSCTGISNDDASISPLNSADADKYTSVITHSSNIGNHTKSVATHQNYLEKGYCKQLESPVREKEGISVKVEPREKSATFVELPDLNLPVYPVQTENWRECRSEGRERMKVMFPTRMKATRLLRKPPTLPPPPPTPMIPTTSSSARYPGIEESRLGTGTAKFGLIFVNFMSRTANNCLARKVFL